MSSFRIRPHFTETVELGPEEIRRRLETHASGEKARCQVLSFPGYVTLRLLEEEQRFWSPQLNLSLDEAGEGKTQIQGTYGPGTSVWAMYLYGYLVVGFLGTVAAVTGLSQWMIGSRPWALWVLAAMLGCAAGLWMAAQIGQKLAAWQTYVLHQACEDALGKPVEIR